jgi:hypothetical protein
MAAITDAEIGFYLSGGAANAVLGQSLGGELSSTAIASGVLNNLFDDVTGDENAASQVEYRALYVRNGNSANVWEDVVGWLVSQVAGGADLAIGLPTEAANVPLETLANDHTAPTGVVFSAPTSKATGLALGDIPALGYRGLWVRRSANNSAALSNDGATLRVEGDTGSL